MVFELNGKSVSFWQKLSILCHIPLDVYVSIVHNYAREGNNIRRWQVRLITSFNISGVRKKADEREKKGREHERERETASQDKKRKII